MNPLYKKRVDNTGLSGQLYETRALSLVLFRLLHDEQVTNFHLASNMENVGAFDDICFRAEIAGFNRPLLVFIQAKHKKEDDKPLTYPLVKSFHESYVKVKEHFNTNNVFFEGKFEDVQCLFILYTNGKFIDAYNAEIDVALDTAQTKQVRKPYEGQYAEKLASIIGTGDEDMRGTQADSSEENLELASDILVELEVLILAEHFSKFLNDQSIMIFTDKFMEIYHVVLARKAMDISSIQSEVVKPKEKVKKADKAKGNRPAQKPEQYIDKNKTAQRSEQGSGKSKAPQNSDKHLSTQKTDDVSEKAKSVQKPTKTSENKQKSEKPKKSEPSLTVNKSFPTPDNITEKEKSTQKADKILEESKISQASDQVSDETKRTQASDSISERNKADQSRASGNLGHVTVTKFIDAKSSQKQRIKKSDPSLKNTSVTDKSALTQTAAECSNDGYKVGQDSEIKTEDIVSESVESDKNIAQKSDGQPEKSKTTQRSSKIPQNNEYDQHIDKVSEKPKSTRNSEENISSPSSNKVAGKVKLLQCPEQDSDKNKSVPRANQIPDITGAGKNSQRADKISEKMNIVQKSAQTAQQDKHIQSNDQVTEKCKTAMKNLPSGSDNNNSANKPDQKEEKEKKTEPKPEIRRYREMKFRPDFFTTNDKVCTVLRKKLYEILINSHIKNKKKVKGKSKDDPPPSNDDKENIENLISAFLSDQSAINLSHLLGTYVTYKDKQFKFIVDRPDDSIQKLEQINESQTDWSSIVAEAEIMVAKNILQSLTLKVPPTFGNLDLTIVGDNDKIQNRLKMLMDFIVPLCEKSHSSSYIVKIEKNVKSTFIDLAGGIGGAVGNLLVHDKHSKLLKFTEDYDSLEPIAKAFYDKLQSNEIIRNNFKLYRFDAEVKFPKLVLEYIDEAREILTNVVVYDQQSNHIGVEKLLKEEIEKHRSRDVPNVYPVESDKIAVYFQSVVKDLWMATGKKNFVTKQSTIFVDSINSILVEPELSAQKTTFYINNVSTFGLNFIEDILKLMAPVETYSRSILLTDIVILTTIKVIKYVKDKHKYTVLDLECILNLLDEQFDRLKTELKKTNKKLIFVCDNPNPDSRILHTRLNVLVEVTASKEIIVITNSSFLDMAQQYFENIDVVLNDERQSLIDLMPESRLDVIQNTVVALQGEDVNLELLVDDEIHQHIKGAVLNTMIRDEPVNIGTSLSNRNYEEIEYLYVERKVHLAPDEDSNKKYDYVADDYEIEQSKPNGRFIRSFEDISEDIVLITAAPGTGKSTLLTRLSLKSKEYDKELWIVRINLLDHSKAFFDWQTHETVIDSSETMKVICQIIVNNNDLQINLREVEDKLYLDDSTGDVWADFELNMFLHFYNKKKLLFLFDGFDEICPHYKDDVINLLKVMIYPRKHRIWVTSRPYSDILPDLQQVIGKPYVLEYISDTDQTLYLKKYWQQNLKVQYLNTFQLKNVTSYIDFISPKKDVKIGRIFHIFCDYLRWYFPEVIMYRSLAKGRAIMLNPNLTEMGGKIVERRADILMGTPLLLRLYAAYFIHLICNDKKTPDWNLTLKESTLTIYENYVDTKLIILLEDKNEIDVSKPGTINEYNKDYIECFALHKKLAANNLFFRRIRLEELKDLEPFTDETKYEAAVNEIKCGMEKIGLITHVTADNMPVFIYKSLEEYFATEYLCDILRDEDIDFARKSLMYSIAHITYGIFSWLSKKEAVDEVLRRNVREIERKRAPYASMYGYFFATGWPIEQLIRLRSAVKEDFEDDCFAVYDALDFMKVVRRLGEEEQKIETIKFQKGVISKMKPHLRKHFVSSFDDDAGPSSSSSS